MLRKSFFLLLLIVFLASTCCYPTHAFEENADPLSGNSRSAQFPLFDRLDELEEYLQETDLPAGFIKPDAILSLGTFNKWINLAYSDEPENTDYYYVIDLHDEDDELWLRVEHYDATDRSSCSVLGMDRVAEDMTMLSDDVRKSVRYIIKRGNLIFYYASRKLISIHWQNEFATFTIGPYYQSYDDGFTYTPGSFMEKLLSLDDEKFREAESILMALSSSGSKHETPPDTGDPIILVIVLLLVSAAAIAIFQMKKNGNSKKKLIFLFLLCLLLTACQSNPESSTTKSPLKPAATSPTPTSTPATVPPTSTAAPKNTVENVKRITNGMTFAEVQDLLGEDYMQVGAEPILYQWPLTNDQFALITFAQAENSEELTVTNITYTFFAYG